MVQRPTERELVTADGVNVRVLRSARRRRTVSGVWKDGAAVISIPATLSLRQENDWVDRMVPDILARRAKALGKFGENADTELMQRAQRLNRKYLQSRAEPLSVKWVTNQNTRWGSTSTGSGAIRLNHRLQQMPSWVQDYILVHELAHLIAEDGHGPQFKALEARFERLDEAKAYLWGVSFGMAQEQETEGTHRGPPRAGSGPGDREGADGGGGGGEGSGGSVLPPGGACGGGRGRA
ncbi:MAG: M48 family metallopeptidase, partial [Micrococcaceae bacterium]|nr:M48 family metallopeptidase [Micrococcaceae bacterium]